MSHHGLCSNGPHTLLLGSDTTPFWVDQLALSHCWAPLWVPWGILSCFLGPSHTTWAYPNSTSWPSSLSHCRPPMQAPQQGIHLVAFKKWWPGFPWWFSGGEPACQCRRHEFWSGTLVWSLVREDPHAEEQLSPCITSMEPVLEAAMEPGSSSFWAQVLQPLKPALCNKRRHRNKKPPCWN